MIEATGRARTLVEQCLSKGPSMPVIRRHTKSEREMHFEPALRVVSGNYVAAKRRGVVEGMDFGYTGEVRLINQVGGALHPFRRLLMSRCCSHKSGSR